MPGTEQQQPIFQFGVFELNPRTRELRKHGVKLKLQDQPAEILALLLEHAGDVVQREDIKNRLWPENTYVDFDNAINSAVRKLRDALGDSPENPRFVETLARRGYRFIAPVNGPAPVQPVRKPGDEERERGVPIRKLLWAMLAVLVFVIGAAIVYKRHFEQSHTISDALPPPVPLTTYPGFQWAPSFSPEGSRVAFAWDQPGKRRSNIYVKLIGGSEPVRLTTGNDADFAPAWSPDGRYIAFLRARAPLTTAVMLIPSLGGPERELTRLQLDPAVFLEQ